MIHEKMEVKALLNNLRTAPRKVRLVADLIRNKSVAQARDLLLFTVKRPSDPMLKLLNSAVASAVTNLKLREENLYIARIFVDEGPKLKRMHPMSRGRGYPIMKRTSHITLVLGERNAKPAKNNKKEKAVIPVEKPAEVNVEKKVEKLRHGRGSSDTTARK